MATDIREMKSTSAAWPTMYDLPDSNDHEGMPDQFHFWQALLLLLTFRPPGYYPGRCFSAADMNLVFDPREPAKRPDWFGVVGVGRMYRDGNLRTSYVVGDEGVKPLIIVELLSRGTARADLGETVREQDGRYTKWEAYEEFLKVPYYVIYGRRKTGMIVHRHDGERLREVKHHDNRLWMEEAGLGLGVWRGEFRGSIRSWLRFYDRDGLWIPTDEEEKQVALRRAEAAETRLEQERAEKERERAEKEKLIAKLRKLGIDPDQV